MPSPRSLFLLLAVPLLSMLWASSAPAADPSSGFPSPSPYPISWELKFKHSLPKRIVVDVPGYPTPQAYWYMSYTVTNHTDREQDFLPLFELLGDNGQLF